MIQTVDNIACDRRARREVAPRGLALQGDRRRGRLTPRLVSVLAMLRRGWTNEQIAVELNLSPGTVHVYVCDVTRITGKSRSFLANPADCEVGMTQ